MSRCQAHTNAGHRCSYNAKEGSGYCGIHQKSYNGGRPSVYKAEFTDQAYKLALLGATDKDLADFFGVTEETINDWKRKKQEFSESVTRGKDIADADVAHSFHKRAVGYDYDEVRQEARPTDNGRQITKVVKVNKHIPADTGAALNWLKNRQPDKWRDNQAEDFAEHKEMLRQQRKMIQMQFERMGKN